MKKAKKVLFLGLDAAVPDLVKKFVDEGNMPNTAKLMDQGIFSRVETVFPTLTAAAWTAIVSGAGSGTNGVPSLMVKHLGEDLDHWHTSFSRNEVLCETLWEVGSRSGLKSALINWPVTFPLGGIDESNGLQVAGSLNPPFRYFFMPLWDAASGAIFSDKSYRCNQIPGRSVKIVPKPAEGWSNLPDSFKPVLEFEITVPPVYIEGYKMQVAMYASASEGYDRVLISETKDASKALTDITMGDYGPWIVKNFKARDRERDGCFRFQLIELSKDGKHFKLYQSAINTAENYCVPESLTEEVKKAAGAYMEVDDPWAFMDGWMPMELYMEQLGFHADWWGNATNYVLKNKEWDLGFSWIGTIDHIEHVLYSGIVPKSRIYDPDKADWCMDQIRNVYKQVDKNIGRILEAVDLEETYVLLVSDHGFTHQDWSPYLKEILARKGLLSYNLDLTNDDPSNLSINWEKTKCHPLEPGHTHIFVNLKGRDPKGIVEPQDYEKVQEEIINALMEIKNPETGRNAVSVAIKKQVSSALGVYEGPGYDRIGDVVFAWEPGFITHPFIYRVAVKYRDGSERIMANPELFEPAVLCQNFCGAHHCLPSEHDMHALLIMAGPGTSKFERKLPGRVIDIAPTISKLLGIDVPRDAEGGVMYDVLDRIKK